MLFLDMWYKSKRQVRKEIDYETDFETAIIYLNKNSQNLGPIHTMPLQVGNG